MKVKALLFIISTVVVGPTWALEEDNLRHLQVSYPGYDGPCTYTGTGSGSCCIGVPVCVNGRNQCLTPRDAEKDGIPSGAQCGCCAGSPPAPRPGTGGVTVPIPFQPQPPPSTPPVPVPFQPVPPPSRPPVTVPFQPVPSPTRRPTRRPTRAPTSRPPTGGGSSGNPGFFVGPIVITVNGNPVRTIPVPQPPPAPAPRPDVGGVRDPTQGTDFPDYDGPCEYFGADDRACCIGVPVCINDFIFMCLTPSDAKRRFPDNAECGCCNGGSFVQREYVPDPNNQASFSSSAVAWKTAKVAMLWPVMATIPFLFG